MGAVLVYENTNRIVLILSVTTDVTTLLDNRTSGPALLGQSLG